MELIKQLNENWKTDMDEQTFARLVHSATGDVSQLGPDASEEDQKEIVWGVIENVPGFEEVEDASKLFNKLWPEVRSQL